jgi:Cu+-exporting ATPase
MQVDTASAAATVVHHGTTYFFCAPRCADRFSANPTSFLDASMREDEHGAFVDPICGMRVGADTAAGMLETPDGPVYFCSLGCRDRYAAGPAAQPGTSVVHLGKKPPRA